jgi:tetratricopeptide (TPR) repeat protein
MICRRRNLAAAAASLAGALSALALPGAAVTAAAAAPTSLVTPAPAPVAPVAPAAPSAASAIDEHRPAAAGDEPPPAGPRASWVQVRTPYLVLYTDADEAIFRSALKIVEQLRSTIGQLAPELKLTAPRPSYLYLFADGGELAPYLPASERPVWGFVSTSRWASTIAISAQQDLTRTGVCYLYLRHLLRDTYRHLPFWLEEGLALYYSQLFVAGGEARIELPSGRLRDWMSGGELLALPQLLAFDDPSTDPHAPAPEPAFYVESLALVQYLMVGAPGGRPQLAHFMALLETGVPRDRAFTEAFGAGSEHLEQELRAWIAKGELPAERAAVKTASDLAISVTPLSHADLLYRQGELHLAAHALPQAAASFRAALAADPAHALATAGLGEVEDLGGHRREAQAYYEKAVQLAPGEAFVHFLLGRTLTLQLSAASRAMLPRAVKELRRATEIEPGLGDAWAALAITLSAVRPTPPEAEATFETAHRLLPQDLDLTLALACFYATRGERGKADRLLEQARAGNVAPADAARVRRAAVQADYLTAERLIASGEVEQARPYYERVAAGAEDERLRADAIRMLAEVRTEIQRRGRFSAAYDQAVRLADRGDVAGAIAKLRALLSAGQDPILAERARRLLASLEARLKPKGS